MVDYVLKKEAYNELSNNKKSLIIYYDSIYGFCYHQDGKETIFKKFDDKFKNIVFVFRNINKDIGLKVIDKIICEVKKIERKLKNKDIKAYVYFENCNSNYIPFIITSTLLLNIYEKRERIDFLYDSICEYLDDIVVKNNVCGFENDKCIAKRNTNCTMGCCHHFNNIYFGLLYEKKMHLCEYQKDKSCTAKCLTCKMYMCDTLKKKGYKYTTRNVLLIKRYFNPIQKLVIITSFFTPKDKIMKRLMFFSI